MSDYKSFDEDDDYEDHPTGASSSGFGSDSHSNSYGGNSAPGYVEGGGFGGFEGGGGGGGGGGGFDPQGIAVSGNGTWGTRSQNGEITFQVNKEKGRLGMEVRTSKSKGTVILRVKKEKLAHRCGLQPGDVIVQINGTEVRGWNHMKVNEYLKKVEVITITVVRPAANAAPGDLDGDIASF